MNRVERNFCVYCNPRDVNDATFRYLEVIRQGLRGAGLIDVGLTQDPTILCSCELVISISCLPAMRALLLHPRAHLVHWFQGIEAVERRYLHPGWSGLGRYVLWSAMEKILLRRANLKLFVSEEMRSFMRDDGRPGSISLVMPCYNVDFDEHAWSGPPDRYSRLDLVYAGSLYPWQCVEDSLLSFKELSQRRPDARLTLFTREVERAQAMCQRHGLGNVHVESLSPAQLREALRHFSYGFILREPMPINEVSTPTKFNTYLASGVIPILTDATPALTRMLDDCSYKVVVDHPSEHAVIAKKIQALSENAPDERSVHDSYLRVFAVHFTDATHARRIKAAVQER